MCSKVFTVDILSFLFHFELDGEMSGQKGEGVTCRVVFGFFSF